MEVIQEKSNQPEKVLTRRTFIASAGVAEAAIPALSSKLYATEPAKKVNWR